jgi:hypothetical protein
MVNHEGKANRRFQCRVQVQSVPQITTTSGHQSGMIAASENDANLRRGQRL